MGCTSHCRSGLVEMAVTVGMKLALETADRCSSPRMKKEETDVSEQVGGEQSSPVTAGSRERGREKLRQWTARVFIHAGQRE